MSRSIMSIVRGFRFIRIVVILMLRHGSGRIGCAYYDPVRCTLYVFEDTQENKHYDLTKTRESTPHSSRILQNASHDSNIVLEQCTPDVVLTSSKADDNFIDILRDHSTSPI